MLTQKYSYPLKESVEVVRSGNDVTACLTVTLAGFSSSVIISLFTHLVDFGGVISSPLPYWNLLLMTDSC